MTAVTYSRQKWRDMVAECKNIDAVLALPNADPVPRTQDGTIKLTDAVFGWPCKPPDAYSINTNDTAWRPRVAAEGGGEAAATTAPLQKGEEVTHVDGKQEPGDELLVVRAGGAEGFVAKRGVTKLPAKKLADWDAASPAIAGVNLDIEQGELVLVSGPVARCVHMRCNRNRSLSPPGVRSRWQNAAGHC